MKSFAVTNSIKGDWNQAGAVVRARGEIVSTGLIDPAISQFRVDCNGQIVGSGQDNISGWYVHEVWAQGTYIRFRIEYTGFQAYTFTGMVVPGANGQPELDLNVNTTSGSQTTRLAEFVVEPPVPASPPPVAGTEDLSGQSFSSRVPILFYDPDNGRIDADLSDSSAFKHFQAIADRVTSGQPMDVTYSGGATYENTSPVILSVVPQYQQFFLKDIEARNPVTATINWRGGGTPRKLVWEYGTEPPIEVENPDEVVTETFDMGKEHTVLKVTISDDDETVGPEIIHLTKVAVPDWADPAGLQGGDGIVYNGQLQWPLNGSVIETLNGIPFMASPWNVGASLQNDVEVKAFSQGPPAQSGSVNIAYRLGLPFDGYNVNLRGSGFTETTLSASDMTLKGEFTANILNGQVQKRVGVLDLVPGAASAVRAASTRLYNFLNGAGLTLTLQAGIDATPKFESAGTELKFTTASARADFDVNASITLVPEPLDSLIHVQVDGGGHGCITLALSGQKIDVDDVGATLRFSASAGALGFGPVTVRKDWPFGGGCGSAPASIIGSRAYDLLDLADGGGIPTSARPAIALSPGGQAAIVWSAPGSNDALVSSDLYLSYFDGASWGPGVSLTDDSQADQAPKAAFDRQGRLLVAWQRNETPDVPNDFAQLDAFSLGLEIVYAVVNPGTGEIVERGALTENETMDASPILAPAANGDVLLGWLATTVDQFGGAPGEPAVVHTAFWDGESWSAREVAAGGVAGLLTWSGAALSRDEAVLGMTIDQDNDWSTRSDREIYLLERSGGTWRALRRVTDNAEDDWAIQLGYAGDGRLSAGWLNNGRLVGLRGDLSRAPEVWIEFHPALDPGFANGRLLARDNRLLAVWPAGNDLNYSVLHDAAASPPQWSLPSPMGSGPASGPEIETAFAVQWDGGESVRVASVVAPIVYEDGFPKLAAAAQPRLEQERLSRTSEDSDNDGVPDSAEIQAGTDPGDPESRLQIVSAERVSADRFALTWRSVAGKAYRIESSADLRTWTTRTQASGSTTTTRVEISSSAESAEYYRIVVE